ncbi:MAG: tetratricopeptide repeat protein [Flavobacteriaceae bacterium]|nr:tetratricopeptide repeat protein [Flavobacteriaceae bacterium]
MQKILLVLFVLTITFVHSQNVQLANDYFRKGEYDKSAMIYKKLYKKNTNNRTYFKRLLTCYQEKENFEKAKELIEKQKINFPKQYYLHVELGYNYQLQNKNTEAILLYQKAIGKVKEYPNSANLTGRSFRENHLLDYALQAYEIAMKKSPKSRFGIYIASIYGEKTEIDKMFNTYLDMVNNDPNYYASIQRYIAKFITDDSENENNKIFKKLVLNRLQDNPLDAWNNLLSWLYMQQKDYTKSLVQEKAIFKRSSSSLKKIFDLATITLAAKDYDTATKAYTFILENTDSQIEIIRAKQNLLRIEVETVKTQEKLNKIKTKFNTLFIEYGKGSSTLNLQIAYADFLTFKLDKPNEAIIVLKEVSKVAVSKYIKGNIKIKLADILVYTDKFNQALITYTQVQSDLKGSEVAQIARLKIAKTSYYKGDFDWARIQLKVLKSATSKLISNDALKLNLLIGDNIAEDTIRIALKKYAKADLLSFQNKNKQAIDTLSILLKEFKGHAIEDEALLKQAELYKKTNQYAFAENNYQKIITLKKDGILVDDALYSLGNLYKNELNDTEKAKEMYQKIIFDFVSSIYLVDARKKFRELRGDKSIE